MKILITGAAGFIGSNLAIKLVESDNEVIGIDNLSHGFMRNLDAIINCPKFTFIMGDLTKPALTQQYNSDVVVHLASQKIPRYTSALRTLEENNLMLRHMITKCIKDKSKLIFASTSDVYGKNTQIPFNEESDLTLGPTTVKRWSYAASKIVGEQLIIANHDEYSLEYTIVRFFGSYGPNQNTTWWGGPQSVFIQNILEHKPIEIHGDGQQTRTFTYIDDTVQGIIRSIYDEKSTNQIYNIASEPDEEISIRNLGFLIWEIMKGKDTEPELKYIPYNTFGKYEDVLRRVPDISKIKADLGYNPHFHLEDGLKITIDWQKKLHKELSAVF